MRNRTWLWFCFKWKTAKRQSPFSTCLFKTVNFAAQPITSAELRTSFVSKLHVAYSTDTSHRISCCVVAASTDLEKVNLHIRVHQNNAGHKLFHSADIGQGQRCVLWTIQQKNPVQFEFSDTLKCNKERGRIIRLYFLLEAENGAAPWNWTGEGRVGNLSHDRTGGFARLQHARRIRWETVTEANVRLVITHLNLRVARHVTWKTSQLYRLAKASLGPCRAGDPILILSLNSIEQTTLTIFFWQK